MTWWYAHRHLRRHNLELTEFQVLGYGPQLSVSWMPTYLGTLQLCFTWSHPYAEDYARAFPHIMGCFKVQSQITTLSGAPLLMS